MNIFETTTYSSSNLFFWLTLKQNLTMHVYLLQGERDI